MPNIPASGKYHARVTGAMHSSNFFSWQCSQCTGTEITSPLCQSSDSCNNESVHQSLFCCGVARLFSTTLSLPVGLLVVRMAFNSLLMLQSKRKGTAHQAVLNQRRRQLQLLQLLMVRPSTSKQVPTHPLQTTMVERTMTTWGSVLMLWPSLQGRTVSRQKVLKIAPALQLCR